MTSQRSTPGSFSAIANVGHAISRGGGGDHFHMHTCAPMASQLIIPGAPFQRLNGAKARVKIDSARESGHGPFRPRPAVPPSCPSVLGQPHVLVVHCTAPSLPAVLLCHPVIPLSQCHPCHKTVQEGGTMFSPWAPRPGVRTMSSHSAPAPRQGTALGRLQNRACSAARRYLNGQLLSPRTAEPR